MNLKYQYRWYYVVIILSSTVGIVYFYIVQPAFQESLLLREKIAHLDQLPREAKGVMHGARLKVGTVERSLQAELVGLFLLSYRNGLHVESMHVTPHHALQHFKTDQIQLVISGSTHAAIDFLFSIITSSSSLVLTDFLIESMAPHRLHMQLNILFVHDVPVIARSAKRKACPGMFLAGEAIPKITSFCLSETALTPYHDPILLQHTSIKQMHLVGFLKENEQSAGLIALPNGATFIVHPGDSLGQERGIILSMQRDHLVVSLDQKNQVITYVSMD